jgi:hypothetical protein
MYTRADRAPGQARYRCEADTHEANSDLNVTTGVERARSVNAEQGGDVRDSVAEGVATYLDPDHDSVCCDRARLLVGVESGEETC